MVSADSILGLVMRTSEEERKGLNDLTGYKGS